jgi:hypothetical protein
MEKTAQKEFPGMSRQAFVATVTINSGLTEEEFKEVGMEIVPCKCGLPHCSGWTIRKIPEFSMDKFNRTFS